MEADVQDLYEVLDEILTLFVSSYGTDYNAVERAFMVMAKHCREYKTTVSIYEEIKKRGYISNE